MVEKRGRDKIPLRDRVERGRLMAVGLNLESPKDKLCLLEVSGRVGDGTRSNFRSFYDRARTIFCRRCFGGLARPSRRSCCRQITIPCQKEEGRYSRPSITTRGGGSFLADWHWCQYGGRACEVGVAIPTADLDGEYSPGLRLEQSSEGRGQAL